MEGGPEARRRRGASNNHQFGVSLACSDGTAVVDTDAAPEDSAFVLRLSPASVHRTAGTPASGCDGSFALDLNALVVPELSEAREEPRARRHRPSPALYRDPLSTSNQTTSLSDASSLGWRP